MGLLSLLVVFLLPLTLSSSRSLSLGTHQGVCGCRWRAGRQESCDAAKAQEAGVPLEPEGHLLSTVGVFVLFTVLKKLTKPTRQKSLSPVAELTRGHLNTRSVVGRTCPRFFSRVFGVPVTDLSDWIRGASSTLLC